MQTTTMKIELADSASTTTLAVAHMGSDVALSAPSKSVQRAGKHGVGQLAAALLIIVLLPVLLIVAAAVKLSSPGAVLYRQRRVGRHGQTFEILKFRSMSDAPDSSFVPQAGSAPGGVEGIDRRTAVGTFLRRTSLDELPQLLNVLKGDMSLVGPRPERPEFVELFADEVPGYSVRHEVRVGMTGLAQVRGLRGKTSIAERAAADAEYVRSWSLLLDLKILFLTFGAVLQAAE